MSTDLNEMQFEILPTEDAESGVVFGIGADVSISDAGFIPGDDDWIFEDDVNPRRGGVAFGREQLNGPTWGWNLHTDADDVSGAIAAKAAIKTAWRAAHLRDTPGAVLPIRYRLDGRYRRVYGRPRRFSAPPDNMILGGYVPITTDFQCVDAYTYDDVADVVVLRRATGSQGGITFPTTFPVLTIPVGQQQGQAVVGGDAATYPMIRFYGPVTNPTLQTDSWSFKLALTIPDGHYVDVDLRSWKLSVLLDGVSSVAGAIVGRSYLSDMSLDPGPHMLVFGGAGTSASGRCEVRWNNAWNSY